jgi:hypothetical protein
MEGAKKVIFTHKTVGIVSKKIAAVAEDPVAGM